MATEQERAQLICRMLMGGNASARAQAVEAVERACEAEAELQAAREELDDANRALGESLSPEAVDDLLAEQTKALREKLAQVLDWPLPNGTVETWSLPGWLAREARALAGQRAKRPSDPYQNFPCPACGGATSHRADCRLTASS